jgi:Ribonuclease G/E
MRGNEVKIDTNALMNILRETIKEHIRENGLVTNPEKLIQRFGRRVAGKFAEEMKVEEEAELSKKKKLTEHV